MLATDFGDAPDSYGDAAHVTSYGFDGGTVPVDTPTAVNDPAFQLATSAAPAIHLGPTVDPESEPSPSVGADGDDLSGNGQFGPADDEGALTSSTSITTLPGQPYSATVTCTGAGAAIAGWIDWDQNGTFDASDRSADTTCAGGTATLTWASVPERADNPSGVSYLRVRIANDAAQIAEPDSFATSGEVEDHRVFLTSPPAVTSPTEGGVAGGADPISGTGNAGDTVTVTDGEGNVVCETTVAADGTWECTPATPLAEGPQSLTASQTDPNGVVSEPSEPVSFTVVNAPTVTGPECGDVVSSTDPITGTGTPGNTVTVTDAEGNTVCEATVAEDGTWECTPTTPLAEGPQTLTATQTDADGNVGAPSAPVDVNVVNAPAITSPTDDGVMGGSDPITGTGTPGDTVTVTDAEGNTVCEATVAEDGTWERTPTTPLAEGPQTLTATQTDADGNVSAPSTPVDVTVVNAPAITGPADGDVVGGSDPITGTGTPGNTVTDADGNVVCETTVAEDGTWECTPEEPLAEGSQTLTATQTDADGNVSAPSTPVEVTVVNAPTVTGPEEGSVVSPTTPITGTGTPGNAITIRDADGNVVCETTVDEDGTWSCTPDNPLPVGSNTLTVTQTDADGNESAPVSITFTVEAADGGSEPTPSEPGENDDDNLPSTGGELIGLTGIALMGLLIAAGLVLALRRRKATEAADV